MVDSPRQVIDSVDVTPPVVIRESHGHIFRLRTSDKLNSVRIWRNTVSMSCCFLSFNVLLVKFSKSVDFTFLWLRNLSDLRGMRVGLILPSVDWDTIGTRFFNKNCVVSSVDLHVPSVAPVLAP